MRVDFLGALAMRYNRSSVQEKQKILLEVAGFETAEREMFVTMAVFYNLVTVCES